MWPWKRAGKQITVGQLVKVIAQAEAVTAELRKLLRIVEGKS